MGQSQSSNNNNGNSGAIQDDAPLQRDYYELLGVERTATDDEIKKAYRRKALELHPDRNYGNVEETTKLFAEVQLAYEVLSDAQERAWYDSHRDVLLRGDTRAGQQSGEFSYNVKMTTADEVLKLMLKFNGRLDYSDMPSGFYGGLKEFFERIAKEEDIACQWEDEDYLDYPVFGSKEDDYEDVVRPFYAAWTGFATKKSYAWKDQYRLSDAPDRRIRRLMEKENKKLRDEAIQEYNDAVRSLVAFVRKRDPRVRNNQKSEAERQQALREAAAAQAARARAAQQAKTEELKDYVVPDWARSRTVDEHEGGFSSESDIEEHEFDCVVCDKTFKSEAQFKAHEKSKKHAKLLKQLQREMRAEGKELHLEQDHTTNGIVPVDENGEEGHETKDVEAKLASAPSNNDNGDDNDEKTNPHVFQQATKSDDEANQPWLPTSRSSHVNKVQPRSETKAEVVSNGGSDTEQTGSDNDDEDSDYASRSAIEDRLTGAHDENVSSKLQNTTLDSSDTIHDHKIQLPDSEAGSKSTSTSTSTSMPKLGKAKQKRAKKAAAAEAASTHDSEGASSSVPGSGDFACAVCGGQFASKTKLFNHIKEKNHAAPVNQIKGSGSAKKTKGKRK